MVETKELSQRLVRLKLERRNVLLFKLLEISMTKLGFKQITEETLRKNAVRFDLEPPNTKRIKQTKDQVSFELWFEDYCIVVHTSFNPNLGENGAFTTAGGSGWILVTEKSEKRVYVRQFYRSNMGSFIDNMITEAELLVNRLQQRPVVENTNLLYKLKQTFSKTFWVSPLNRRKKKPFYLGTMPPHVRKHFDKYAYRTKYYQDIRREKEGTTVRKHKKRKVWR